MLNTGVANLKQGRWCGLDAKCIGEVGYHNYSHAWEAVVPLWATAKATIAAVNSGSVASAETRRAMLSAAIDALSFVPLLRATHAAGAESAALRGEVVGGGRLRVTDSGRS